MVAIQGGIFTRPQTLFRIQEYKNNKRANKPDYTKYDWQQFSLAPGFAVDRRIAAGEINFYCFCACWITFIFYNRAGHLTFVVRVDCMKQYVLLFF